MRKDMGKVITEAARYGSRNRNMKTGMSVKWKGEDDEYDIPSKASNSAGRQYGYSKKEFSDVLGPIRRYVEKHVGHKWDDVYSEMCKVLDKRKLTHKHVFTHVEGWVSTDVYLGKDRLYHERPWGSIVDGMYVDPETGILKRQVRPVEEHHKPLELIVINDFEEYKKIGGIWYYAKWIPGGTFTSEKFCNVRKKYLKRDLLSKRQLGKKELKKLGLR